MRYTMAITLAVTLLSSLVACNNRLSPALDTAASGSSWSAANDSYGADAEALYLKRFKALRDPASTAGLSAYDPLKSIAGHPNPVQLQANPSGRISRDALRQARDYAASNNSSTLLVWHEGNLESAHFFGNYNDQSLLVSKSLAKPLSVIAVGRAIKEGFIKHLDEPVANYIQQWRDSPKAAITIRQLLGMRSGLLPQGSAPTADNVLNRAYLHPWHDSIIINEYPLVHLPGTRYDYSNANSELVAPLIERATGIDYEDWVAREVLTPIGAAGGQVWMNRIGGTAHAGCCWLMPAKTWLRLAILLINDGFVDGTRLLPAGFLQAMTTGTEQNPHAGLGVFVAGEYIARRGPANPDSTFSKTRHSEPYLTADLFLFDGNANQVIYISPSARLIIARLGDRPPATPGWDNARLPNLIIRGLEPAVQDRLLTQPLRLKPVIR